MTDPRNVAHDKKVQQEKKHHGIDPSAGMEHQVQPGKKPHVEHVADTDAVTDGQPPIEDGSAEKSPSGDHT